jgi:hypothetical protein
VTEPRRDPGWFRVYWPLLLLVGVPVLFGAPEGLALWFPGVGGTASEWTRDVLGGRRRRAGHAVLGVPGRLDRAGALVPAAPAALVALGAAQVIP